MRSLSIASRFFAGFRGIMKDQAQPPNFRRRRHPVVGGIKPGENANLVVVVEEIG